MNTVARLYLEKYGTLIYSKEGFSFSIIAAYLSVCLNKVMDKLKFSDQERVQMTHWTILIETPD